MSSDFYYWQECYNTHLNGMYAVYIQKFYQEQNGLKNKTHIKRISYPDFCVLIYNQSYPHIYPFDERR